MKNMLGAFALIASACLLPAAHRAFASPQDPPMEWGSVSAGDLAMKTYPPDTNASAVVLCDFGETKYNNEAGLTYKRHTRMKILSKAGYDWATQSVTVYSRNHYEKAEDIEGATFNLGSDGQVVRTELDEKSVFKEEVNSAHTRYRFTLPALQPGCVIEFRYTIKTRPYEIEMIRDWCFQGRLPVVWSEYRVMMPQMIAYAVVTTKILPFFVDEMTQTHHLFFGSASSYVGSGNTPCNQFRWIVRDAPAIPAEPYMTSVSDFAQKVDLQLAEFARLTVGTVKVTQSWENLVTEFLEDEEFKKGMEPGESVRRISEQVSAGLTAPEQKMEAVYDYIRRTIVWNNEEGFWASREPDEVLATRKGGAPEIALLLISMLKCVGIESDPLLVSTRSNGTIQTLYPIITQFNYLIARAVVGGRLYFLDATDPLRPIDLPPMDLLKVEGLVLKKGPVEWVTVNSPRIFVHSGVANVRVKAGGEIEGTVESVDEQYSALLDRRALRNGNQADFAKQAYDADRSGLVIDSVAIAGEDSTAKPLRIRARVSSASYTQAAGDMIYINPAVIDRQHANPFKRAVRTFPVNMPCGLRSSTAITIVPPEGYEVKEWPKDANIRVGRDDAIFFRRVSLEGGMVHVNTNFNINRTDYQPDWYNDLRQFYERMTSMQSDQVVLQRKPAPPSKAAPASGRNVKR